MQSRKRNVHHISNKKVSLLDRMYTFDGPEHFSTTGGVKSPVALLDLEKICINIVKHI